MRLKKKIWGFMLSLALALGLMPGTSMTTYAEPVLPPVTISPENAGTVTTGTSGNYYTFSATPADGYRFVKWTGEKSSGSLNTFTNNPWRSLTDNFDNTSSYGYYTNVTAVFEEIIAVSSISLDQSAVSLSVDGTQTLTPTISPDNATYKTVTWKSDNESVATVSNGVVTAVAEGTANITVTATNGTDDASDDMTATCEVTVEPISYNVTYKVVNGAWDEGDKADRTITLTGENVTLGEENIPHVGTKPDAGYKEGSWDVTPTAGTTITVDVTFTYTYVKDISGESSGGSSDSSSTSGGSSDSGSSSGSSSSSNTSSGTSSSSSSSTSTSTPAPATVPYDKVVISTGAVNDITGTAAATAESNPFGTKIENNDNLTTLLALTPEEVAQGVNVWLDIQDMSATVPQAEKDLVQSASNNFTVGMYLDINLFKKVGGNAATKIIETNGTVKASILIPESLWKAGRTFEIIRVHEGVPTVISGTYDENTHVFTFETDKFSTYALAYNDSANSTQSTAPRTGDNNHLGVWYLLLAVSLGGLGYLGYTKKKRVNK